MATQDRIGKESIDKDSVVDASLISLNKIYIGELSYADLASITATWNSRVCTRNIEKINPMGARYNNTRLCAGGDLEKFLDTIRGLDSQAWFTERAKSGALLTYDWFCDPNNYQKIIEGNYESIYKQKTDGIDWENA